jgi:hypothetical protein
MLWEIEKSVSKGDYVYAVVPNHPKATKNGYVLEHRVVMENNIGRILERWEEVHHKDENRKNNSPDNLEIKLTGEHQRFHSTKYPNGHFAKLVCTNCGKEFEVEWNKRKPNQENHFCSRRCNGQYSRKMNISGNRKDPNHGVNMYRYGCRCDVCRAAIRDKQRKLREKRRLKPNLS